MTDTEATIESHCISEKPIFSQLHRKIDKQIRQPI